MKFRYALTYLLILFAATFALQAQTVTGRVTGTVTDVSGAAIPGATVNMYLPGGDTPVLTTNTTGEGLYNFIAVNPGTYDISVETTGFARYIARQVKVDPGRETPLDIKLEIQAAQQTVEVVANTEQVQTTNAEVSTTVSRNQVENLPVLDRQVSSLIQTQAGVSNTVATTVNGMRVSMANVTLDGINIQDNYIRDNALDYIPNRVTIDQVEEFTVATSNADASQGGGVGQVIQSSRRGTNEYHGALYWYNRNNYFAANNWFNNQAGIDKPFLNQNQYGGRIGGPIIKDKLLFHFNYENLVRREQAGITKTVLTPSARQGIFRYFDETSGALREVNVLGLRGATTNSVIAQNLQGVPTTFNTFTVGDSTPDQLMNTAGLALNAGSNQDRPSTQTRIDFNLSERHQFMANHQWNREKTLRPSIFTDYSGGAGVFNENPTNFLSASWRWTVSPTFVNEVRGGFNLTKGDFFRSDSNLPGYFVDGLLWSNPINDWQEQGRETNTFSLQNNSNWVKGAHSLQFGYQSQYIIAKPYNFVGTTPTYFVGFDPEDPTALTEEDLPGATANDLNRANVLLASLIGNVNQQTQTFNVNSAGTSFEAGTPLIQDWRLNNHALYITDKWRLLPRLTVTLGLRWDNWGPVREKVGNLLAPAGLTDDNIAEILTSNATFERVGDRALMEADRNNFAPNLGVAWDVFGNGRTSLRAGWSRSFVNDQMVVGVDSAFTSNSGLISNLFSTETYTLGSVPAFDTPELRVPRTLEDNYNEFGTTEWIGAVEPGIQTPRVDQWNVGIQHELGAGFIVEGRYVGAKAEQLWRAIDYNQIDIRNNGFLADFQRAQQNGNLALQATGRFDPRYNRNIAGSQQLTVFPNMVAGGLLTNGTISNLIRTGQPGQLAYTYAINGLNGDVPFFRNPFAVVGYGLGNYGWANYHGGQFEIRRRMRALSLQANYVFSKALGNTSGDIQSRFEPLLDFGNESLEVSRSPFDIRHQIKANGTWDIPFGKGRRWSTNNGFIDNVLGGWMLSGNWYIQSGMPLNILSNRGTLNRTARSASTNTALVNQTGDQLDQYVGFFMTGNGPYFVDPSVLHSSGRAVGAEGTTFEGQIFFNPPAGYVGNLQRRYFSGPWNTQLDAALAKNFVIREGHTLQFRAEAFNLPNHPSFFAGSDTYLGDTNFNINSTDFGTVPYTWSSDRRFQFSLKYEF